MKGPAPEPRVTPDVTCSTPARRGQGVVDREHAVQAGDLEHPADPGLWARDRELGPGLPSPGEGVDEDRDSA